MKYRPDVDGLRALAVIPVVFYHAKLPGFNGGFIGVDIFFVISGYLISRIIGDQIATRSFSILRFYERRIRRIFPALFFVLMPCAVASTLLFVPREYRDFSQSLIAATIFAANILFWKESGYFNAPAEQKPLLHTWSLSVEEQFYLVFPWLLILLWRLKRPFDLHLLVPLLLGSLFLSIWGVEYAPEAAFYFVHMRAWELLLGASLGLRLVTLPSSNSVRNVASIAGLLMILTAVHLYSPSIPFPGAYALLPCMGAALIIWSGESGDAKTDSSWIKNILSTSPFVTIGLVSYSLYLWHWPILVFAKSYLLRNPSALEVTFLITLAFVLVSH